MQSELTTLDRIFGLRRFPPGRLFTVLLAMRMLAIREALDELIERVETGLDRVRRYVDLRRRRQLRRVGRGGGEARKVDRVIDDDIAEMSHIAGKEAERFPNTPSGDAARALVDAFFANGVAPITQIPYDEELAVVENMMPLMRAEHGEAIELLGLERLVARVEAHLPLYRDALAPDGAVSAAELAMAYEAMQVGLLQVVGWVVVMIADAELRAELLAPLFEHDAQLAALFSARRRGSAGGEEDVDTDDIDLDEEARAALEEARRAAEAEAEAAAAAAEGEVDGDVEGDVEAAAPEAPAPDVEPGSSRRPLQPVQPPRSDSE